MNTEVFKRWFGDSKVVDPFGEPLVVYHGTTVDFSAFAPGSFFSESPAESSAYTGAQHLLAHERASGKYVLAKDGGEHHGQLIPYVGAGIGEVANPVVGQIYAADQGVMKHLEGGRWAIFTDLVIDYGFDAPRDQVRVEAGDFLAEAEEEVREYEAFLDSHYCNRQAGGRVIPVFLAIKNPFHMDGLKANRLGLRLGATRESVQQVIGELSDQGYDGIATWSDEAVMIGMDAIRQWVAFRPEQVISAITPEADLQRLLAAKRARACCVESEFSL